MTGQDGRITFYRVAAKDLPEAVYRDLWELSCCRGEELAASFLVHAGYLQEWLTDVKAAVAEGLAYPATYEDIRKLCQTAVAAGYEGIFVEAVSEGGYWQ